MQLGDNPGTLACASQKGDQGKNIMQLDTLLVHFDQDKSLLLAFNASRYVVGAVLSHQMSD